MRLQIDTWCDFSRFLRLERGFGTKPQSFSVYQRRFKKLVSWFHNRDFTRLNFLVFLETEQARGLKNSYLNNFIKMAKQLNRYFHIHEFDEFRLLHEIDPVPKDILRPQDIQAMADVQIPYQSQQETINNRQKALILLLGTTGCRIDEALSLTIGDIHARPAYIVFNDTKNGDNRVVPISEELLNLISKLTRKGSYVFESRSRGKLTQQGAGRDIKERARLCNIPIRVYPHLFRHSYCTEMLNQGVDSVVLAKITGHRDPKTLMTYYHQDLNEAISVTNMHPLLRHEMNWEQEKSLVKNIYYKFYKNTTHNVHIIETKNRIVLELST